MKASTKNIHINAHLADIRCASCAQTVKKLIKRNKGCAIDINTITGDINYDIPSASQQNQLVKELKKIGYALVLADSKEKNQESPKKNYHITLWISCLLTAPLLFSHFLPHLFPTWMHFPWVQLLICLPIYIIGYIKMGENGIRSLLKASPNMNTLIFLSATAALVYSIISMLTNGDLFFFETTGSIITLVMLGEFFEHRSMQLTQREINKLIKHQKITARMITFDDKYQEVYFDVPSESLKIGDLILVKAGERVPSDCKVLSGDCLVDESLMTGESQPIFKEKKQLLYGGSILINGTIKAQVATHTADAVISKIIHLVKQAQLQKPPIQKLADRVSAIFVPVVFSIAVVTFLINYTLAIPFAESMMRAITVLVIACPCALGMATPAAIAIGMGIASRRGIFFKKAKELENFRNIKQAIFDKTGTLTKGTFVIKNFKTTMADEVFKQLVTQIEAQSNHPIAKSIIKAWQKEGKPKIALKRITEMRALGMLAVDEEDNNTFKIGSDKILTKALEDGESHTLYITKNDVLVGWIDMQDEIKEEAKQLIKALQSQKIECILLSGDKLSTCNAVAKELGINLVYGEKTPEEKLTIVKQLTNKSPTMMIGDGINDSPSLSAATIGVAVNDASQLSIEAATVIFTNKNISSVSTSLRIGKQTYKTIVSNLYWAFGYNIIAIPIAAFGWLNPTLAALIMGLSDVILILNSLTLYIKKYDR